MRRYLTVAFVLLLVLALGFAIAELVGVPVLEDPTPLMSSVGTVAAAALGVGLLVSDVFLPVPSSLVMVAHGALFGVWVGTVLSLAGGVGAALFGFWIGRRGGVLLDRMVTPAERARADRLLRRWGMMAIVLTRPIPLLAETVVILAGASPLGWGKVVIAAAAGNLPPALLYALTGWYAHDFASAVLMFVVVMVITGIFWLVGLRLGTEKDVVEVS